MNVTTPREFAARKLAVGRVARAGLNEQARRAASRLAARLLKAGRSVDSSARIAAAQVSRGHGPDSAV